MKIVKWDPFKEMMLVDELFDAISPGKKDKPSTWSPAVDVYETEKGLVLTAELPGVRQEDISLSIYENTLTLKGERKFERDVKHENYFRIERNYGYFYRCFTLPCEVDASGINATFSDGVLKVMVPKADKQTKKVKVSARD